MDIGADNTNSDNNDNTDTPNGSEANTMLAAMDLDNYDPSYDI